MRPDPRDGYSAEQVRAAERPLLDAGELLMARAAAGLARVVRHEFAVRGSRTGRLVVLAGSGSNGGDALLAVAELVAGGSSATVVPLGRRIHSGGLAAAVHAGARVLPPDVPPGRVRALALEADVVLDGLLGTGASTSPALRPPVRQTVAVLADAVPGGPVVVAVDLPSGLGADDGSVHPPLLRADVTVTFGAMKAGLLLAPARVVGRVRLIDIGLELDGIRPRARARA